MSYDITFVERHSGQDWEDALRAAESPDGTQEPLDERRRQQWTEIERRVREVLGDVDGALGETVGELAHPPTGLQVALFAKEAAVSYPYWERPDPDGFHRQLAGVVAAVQDVTGLTPYDPQTGLEFSGTPDEVAGQAHARSLQHQHEEPDQTRQVSADDLTDRQDDAARARRYFFVGGLITFGSIVYLLTVRSSVLIVMALLVGLVDLGIGVHLMRRSRSQQ